MRSSSCIVHRGKRDAYEAVTLPGQCAITCTTFLEERDMTWAEEERTRHTGAQCTAPVSPRGGSYVQAAARQSSSFSGCLDIPLSPQVTLKCLLSRL